MLCQSVGKVDGRNQIAVRQNYIFCLGVFHKAPDVAQCLQTSLVCTAADLAERRQQVQTTFFPCQIPFTAGTQVIQQRAVVGLGDDADLRDAGVYHIGKRKVDKAVSACKRHAAHGAKPRHLAETLVIYV